MEDRAEPEKDGERLNEETPYFRRCESLNTGIVLINKPVK